MSVIKNFLVNILKLILILRKFSALYSYKGYSCRKESVYMPQYFNPQTFGSINCVVTQKKENDTEIIENSTPGNKR